MYTRVRDFRTNLFFMCVSTSNWKKLSSNTFIFLPPFRCQERRSKAKPKTSHNKLFKNQHLKKTLLYSNKDYATEVTLITGPTKQTKNALKHFSINLVTEYRPSVPNLKTILMSRWHLIENRPMLEEIYKDTPLLSYGKGRSLKDLLVRAKLLKVTFLPRPIGAVYMFGLSCHHHFTFNGLGKAVNPRCLTFADCRLQTADCRLQTADCRLQIADCKPQTKKF